MKNLRSLILATGIFLILPINLFASTSVWTIWVDNLTGLIKQQNNYTSNPAPVTGTSPYALDSTTAAAISTVAASSSSVTLTNISGPDASGNYVGTPVAQSAGPTPTPSNLVIGVPAGVGASANFIPGSDAKRGAVSITSGTGPTLGTILTINFPSNTIPIVISVMPYGDNAITVIPYVRSLSTTQLNIGVRTAMAANTTYIFMYIVAY